MAVMMPVRGRGGVRSAETLTQHRIIVPSGLGSSTPLAPKLTASSSRLEIAASSSRLERAMPCTASSTSMRTIKADSASATVPASRNYSRSPPPPRTAPLVRTADHRGPSPSPPAGHGALHAPAIDRTKVDRTKVDRTKVQHVSTMQRNASTADTVPAWARPQGQHTSSTRQLVRLQGEKTWTSPPMVGESITPLAPPTLSHSAASSVSAPPAPAQSSRLLATSMTPPLSSGSGFGALTDVENSPSSTVDLHGATCLRTPSAPDSLLSGTGGLELSDSSSQPSLTISTNSSTREAFHRPADGSSQHKMPLSPVPTVASFVATAVAPARCQGSDLESTVPELALCTENGPPCRAAPQLALQTKAPSLELAGDENVPPGQEGVATVLGKESRETVQVGAGRSEKIAKMCSYWEARVNRENQKDTLGGSFRERNGHTSDSTVLRERQPEAQRHTSSSPKPRHSIRETRSTRSASVSLPRRPGGDSRRCNRRLARQQQLTDDLTALVQVVCPCDMDGLLRSSGSESEEPKEDCDDWVRVVERENKILNKHLRQYTRLFKHFLQKRSASCGPTICPDCVTSLTCPECGHRLDASDIARNATSVRTQGNIAKSSCADKQVDAHMFERILDDRPCLRHEVAPPVLRERNVSRTMDAVNPPWRPTSPTSPPTEEPAGEPDSGLLSN